MSIYTHRHSKNTTLPQSGNNNLPWAMSDGVNENYNTLINALVKEKFMIILASYSPTFLCILSYEVAAMYDIWRNAK